MKHKDGQDQSYLHRHVDNLCIKQCKNRLNAMVIGIFPVCKVIHNSNNGGICRTFFRKMRLN